ncbi:hypothetical protein G7Y89_g10027 [Cudoniella acicularis]|uniref:Uncharacterized protein n=1 Tax=Cudoniella acicularis TaxID=354080 RepID=A0A8H4RDJ4_9HELO|nr:hypothetical protein G7Y89_g10027 [Cudoniella acicularis]
MAYQTTQQDMGYFQPYPPFAFAFGDPFAAHPRIPVTASTLYAYAHMRGKTNQQCDPLHQALFPTPSRTFQQGRLMLPLILKRESMEELPRGATYFWDPIVPTFLPPLQPLGDHKGDSGYVSPPPNGIPLKYDEFIAKYPPKNLAPNHYKGEQVYANFGYVLVEGKWVDPESEGELYKAYMNCTEGPNSKAELPDLQRSRTSGPRVMNQEELDRFYRQYVEDVTDHTDGEGDPRFLRISPATFARWAAGAVKGEHYEEAVMQPQEKLPRSAYVDDTDRAEPFKIKHKNQFDLDTGSMLSGIYDIDQNPPLHLNPHGYTDVIRAPVNFAYSYPQTYIDLEKKAFGSDLDDDTNSHNSTASTPETYNSEKAIRTFAVTGDEDLTTGEAEYDRHKAYIMHLRNQDENDNEKGMTVHNRVGEVVDERFNLSREVFFMQAQLDALRMPPPPPPAPPSPNPKPVQLTPQTSSPEPEPKPRRLRRTQYRRYLREEVQREKIQINRMHKTDERLKDDLKVIMDEVNELRELKEQLVTSLGEVTAGLRDFNYPVPVPRDVPDLGL